MIKNKQKQESPSALMCLQFLGGQFEMCFRSQIFRKHSGLISTAFQKRRATWQYFDLATPNHYWFQKFFTIYSVSPSSWMHAGVCVDTLATQSKKYIWNLCIHLDKRVSLFHDRFILLSWKSNSPVINMDIVALWWTHLVESNRETIWQTNLL